MAIILTISSIAGGIIAGIFFGGFWWIMFGILFGLQIGLVIQFKTKYYEEVFRNSTIPILTFMGAILCGNLLGGFWWILFGLFSGILLGVFIFTIFDFYFRWDPTVEFWYCVLLGGVPGAIILPVLVGKLIGGFLLVFLSIFVGAVLGALCVYKCRRYCEYREIRDEIKAEERERNAIIRERKLPFNERMEAINKRAKEKAAQYNAEIKQANEEYRDCVRRYSNREPEDVLKSFKRRVKIFDGFARIFTGDDPGLNQLTGIAHYFNKRNNILKCKALAISSEYIAWREKAILNVDRLKEITGKFSLNEREVLDVAREYNIKNISIPDIDMDIDEITYITNPFEGSERRAAEKRFFKAIDSIQKKRIEIEAFILRVSEINCSLEKSISVFENMFNNANRLIRNATESNRPKIVNNREKHFNKKEKDELKKLLNVAVSMMDIVDTDL
ncbi:hypothetical protein FACS1894140_5020 [Spirochaetia bacterium]|nr:hypothetical protein FACS1894140_5020 [Spirochaetia bacterium]